MRERRRRAGSKQDRDARRWEQSASRRRGRECPTILHMRALSAHHLCEGLAPYAFCGGCLADPPSPDGERILGAEALAKRTKRTRTQTAKWSKAWQRWVNCYRLSRNLERPDRRIQRSVRCPDLSVKLGRFLTALGVVILIRLSQTVNEAKAARHEIDHRIDRRPPHAHHIAYSLGKRDAVTDMEPRD